MADLIKIASVNCQGLHTSSKRQDVLNFYKKRSGDINVYSIHFGRTQEMSVFFLTIILNLKYTKKLKIMKEIF